MAEGVEYEQRLGVGSSDAVVDNGATGEMRADRVCEPLRCRRQRWNSLTPVVSHGKVSVLCWQCSHAGPRVTPCRATDSRALSRTRVSKPASAAGWSTRRVPTAGRNGLRIGETPSEARK